MDFSKLNKIGKIVFPPKKSLSSLTVNHAHKVTAQREAQTKFGPSLIVTIDDEYQVFLRNGLSYILRKTSRNSRSG